MPPAVNPTHNQKQAAAALGVSNPYLSQLKKKGRIAPEPCGKYDLDKLRAQIKAGADPVASFSAQTKAELRAKARGAAAPAAPKPLPPAPPPPPAVPPAAAQHNEPAYTGDPHEDYKIARTAKEKELAATARVERLEAEKRVCLVADVEQQAYTTARRLRDSLLGAFATKLASKLAQLQGDTFAIEHQLREALREELAERVKDMEAGHADV